MCLIAFGWNPTPQLRLLIAANRDEFHARPTAALGAWDHRPEIIAGRDLLAQGTWLGVSRRGRLAAVTNVRLPVLTHAPQSRGELALRYLLAGDPPDVHAAALQANFADYGPCNLLLVDGQQAVYTSNRPGVATTPLSAGLYGLSNAALDTPWPKTVTLKAATTQWLASRSFNDTEPLFAALASEAIATAVPLPDTGVGIERERFLAPAFIRSFGYGTRCSTVITVDAAGQGLAIERRFGPDGIALGESRVAFDWPT